MTVKVFTKNKDGKIEFTEEELKALLDEVYREGFYSDWRRLPYYTYTTPKWNINYCTDTSDKTSDNVNTWLKGESHEVGK